MRIRWVKVWVDAMATLTERFRDEEGRVDFEALGREEYAFRHALVTGDFSRSERARDLYDATINEITSRSEAGRKGAEARWSKNTADGDTREDSSGRYAPPSFSPEDGNPAETAPSHGGSVASLEARQCQRAGGNSLRVAKVSTPPVRSAGTMPADKHPHGEFGNVMLTTDEYIKLCEKCQDADSLITELDQYIESQGKGKKYKSHYATLLNWSRRKATEAKQPSRYKNINDINRENCEQIERDLRAMFHPEEVI